MSCDWQPDVSGEFEREDGRAECSEGQPLGVVERTTGDVAHLTAEATRLHRSVDAFAALIGAEEERTDHRADNLCPPEDGAAGALAEGGGPGGAGAPHAGRFIGHYGGIAV